MLITINPNVRIWSEFNPVELAFDDLLPDSDPRRTDPRRIAAKLGFNKERIAIKGRWFDVLTRSQLVRLRNDTDGYYRAVYIQVNYDTGEYYIGKVNRPTWSQVMRYQGSGLKFAKKLKKHRDQFVRYYIATCKSAEETEQLESSIVDQVLLADDKCLNLVAGGGGTTKHPSTAETSAKKREHMRRHPEQYRPMLEASKMAFRSGDTPALRERNRRIGVTMGADKYRAMSAARIRRWREENPKEYAEALRKSHEAIATTKCQEKRQASLKKWAMEHPEEHAAWQEKLLRSRTSKEAKEKCKASLRHWAERNPEQAKANAQKRAESAAAQLSKEVCMIDLQTGEVLMVFQSQHEAAKWLVENGKAKNTNCVSSISSVCLRKPCTTGYGYRKKAYGYDWRFLAETETKGRRTR